MTFLVQLLPLFVYSIWMARRMSKGTSAAKPVRPTTDNTTAVGLEDDPDQWLAWTALDERQLVRLLTDSAQVNRPATKAKDNHVRPTEREDTP
ncbi:hypothetical protein [Mycolicibacterium sphagni]|uniref:Uncharacterized protein n=1 Tax=Mycolicibacterium sphagni TaxID=1786 RepID=A0A255D7S2_9MYCO|nr:hypothetical protein [Mycolicibacterium sphagni]MCV7177594.1 hypothetical protein [Mycolicibacterium sphagni]OYN74661.1 hypothetical protein CG716_27775 [Mycolicibacterium sphagni]